MKLILTVVAFGVFTTFPAYTQTMRPRRVIVSSIRKISKTGAMKHKPRIEVEVVSSDPFYVGAQNWGLLIGELCLRWPHRSPPDNHSLIYSLTIEDWNNLKNGDPMYISYGGCPDASNKKLVTPFAYLSKKILGKKPRVIGLFDEKQTKISLMLPPDNGKHRAAN